MSVEPTEDALFDSLASALGVEREQPEYRLHVLERALEALGVSQDDDDMGDVVLEEYEPIEMLVPAKPPPVNMSKLPDDCADGHAAVEWLIHPKQVDSFIQNNDMKPLFISRAKYNGVYSGLFDAGSIIQALEKGMLRYGLDIDVTRVDDGVRKNFNYNKNARDAGKHVVADAEVALKRFTRDKCSLRVLHPQRFTEPLWHLMYMLESFWGSCVGCNAYWTPKHSQGFAPHFDDIDAYVLQVQGTKRWKLYDSVDTQTVLPRFSSRDFIKSELDAPVFDQVIEPGDLLYLPRGYIHEAECLDEDSLHLTISTNQRNSIFEFCSSFLSLEVERQAMSHIRMRRTLPAGFVHSGNSLAPESEQGLQSHMELYETIKQIALHADIASGVDQWFMNFMLRRLPPPQQARIPSSVMTARHKLKKNSTVGLTYYDSAYPILDSTEDEEKLFICHCLSNPREQHQTGDGRDEENDDDKVPPQLELPLSCLETARSLLSPEPISLKDVPETDDETITKMNVANALVDAGILTSSSFHSGVGKGASCTKVFCLFDPDRCQVLLKRQFSYLAYNSFSIVPRMNCGRVNFKDGGVPTSALRKGRRLTLNSHRKDGYSQHVQYRFPHRGVVGLGRPLRRRSVDTNMTPAYDPSVQAGQDAGSEDGSEMQPIAPRWMGVVPDVPFTGDDQGSTIYSALANLHVLGSFDESQFEAETYVREATGRSDDKKPEVVQVSDVEESSLPQEPQGGIPHRWQIVFMMALAFVLCNMDKVNMSVAVIPMAKELGWSATERGLVSSSFFWGYSLTQIPAGWVSTSIGGSKVLMAGVALWSIGTLVAPPAAHMSLIALCATRVFVGLGEGLAPSSATNVLARVIPEGERARAVTAVFGGLDVGSALGLTLCGPLIHWFGWQSVFYLFAILGLIWCLAWPLVKPETREPGEAKPATKAPKAPTNVPWRKFLRSPPVWAVIVAHFCYNWGYYTLLAWLPSYFEMALGLNVEKSSLLTLIPYIAMTFMTPFVGPVADGLAARGWSVTTVRKLSQGIAFAGPALCMLAMSILTPAVPGGGNTILLVAIMSLAFALGAWARAGLYCNHQDLSPKYAAALLGLTNTAGALPGVLGVTAAGYLLDATGSWSYALFYPTILCQVFGLVIYSIFASSERQGWD